MGKGLGLPRIPGELVVECFRDIKMRPIRGEFVNKKRTGCCAMSAVAISKLKPMGIVLDRFNIGLVAKAKIGVSSAYYGAFVAGWDGLDDRGDDQSADFVKGFSDGKTAWEECVGCGLVEE